ncbi:hypothetical protein AB1Y20_002448 [Prymnesium parvum]|uniref:Chloride channel protein n=1 Tax=Prymnesium parvum TaxID=97485 RepID=A0AB34J937_PRYPA
MAAVNSMDFLPVDSRRSRRLAKRGLTTDADSPICEVATVTAVGLLGLVVALVVQALRFAISVTESFKLLLVLHAVHTLPAQLAAYAAAGVVLVVPSVLITRRVNHVKGSGLPLLIAYLNGCKLHTFTSTRVLAAKFVATVLACTSGLCCGPEGPIIHMGACIGKQALRVLYHLQHLPPKSIFKSLGNLDRDEDKGIFVAIGAGAGVAAAFNAPLSGTLFVVEEAASHFSLTLLWRAFSAAMVATWATHLLRTLWEPLNDLLPLKGEEGHHNDEKSFHVVFEQGVGNLCNFDDNQLPNVIAIAALVGTCGAFFNLLILRIQQWRKRFASHAIAALLDAVVVVLLTCTTAILLSHSFPCRDLTIASLEFGYQRGAVSGAGGGKHCARSYEQCGGETWHGATCCIGEDTGDVRCVEVSQFYSQCLPTEDGGGTSRCINDRCLSDSMSSQILEWEWESSLPWNDTSCEMWCDTDTCLFRNLTGASVDVLSQDFCPDGKYNAAASLLLQPVEEVAQALFFRGASHALPATALLLCAVYWFVFSALAATLLMPVGLMVPMMVIGGALGRLLGVLLWYGSEQDPGLYALVGATAFMAGSGQIRLFLTTVMLEVTGNLLLAPYLAATAIVAVGCGRLVSPHGLYHSMIHAAGLPYLPPGRYHAPPPPSPDPSDGSPPHRRSRATSIARDGWRGACEWVCGRVCVPLYERLWAPHSLEVAEVGRVMAAPPHALPLAMLKADAMPRVRGSPHNAFPVVDDAGRPRGLLLKAEAELEEYDELTPVATIMDGAPCIVHRRWPLVRAHRLFASLGLRHLLVVDECDGRLVGIVTRHDLQEHAHGHAGGKAHAEPKLEGAAAAWMERDGEAAGEAWGAALPGERSGAGEGSSRATAGESETLSIAYRCNCEVAHAASAEGAKDETPAEPAVGAGLSEPLLHQASAPLSV